MYPRHGRRILPVGDHGSDPSAVALSVRQLEISSEYNKVWNALWSTYLIFEVHSLIGDFTAHPLVDCHLAGTSYTSLLNLPSLIASSYFW